LWLVTGVQTCALPILAVSVPGASALPPALTTPGNLTLEATSPNGAAVSFSVTSDQPGATITCSPPPNTLFAIGTTTVVCTARGSTGEISRATFQVTVTDTTAPVISGLPIAIVRNVNGVKSAVVTYKAPQARDAVDGLVPADCMPASGSAFALGTTQVACAAVDERGNASAATFDVRLVDRVAPPPVTDVAVRAGEGLVHLSWRPPASKDFAGVVVVRYPGASIVYQGHGTSFDDHEVTASGRYQYVVTSYDWARNRARGVAVFTSTEKTNLIEPQDGATLTAPPLLAWRPVPGADYYNVQIWAVLPSGTVKVFSTWPKANHLQLKETWTFGGKKHRLGKGRYRWYVWPGIGRIVDARYGNLIGTSLFVVG